MTYTLSHDVDSHRIIVKVGRNMMALPDQEGLSIRHAAYPFLSQSGIHWEDIEPVEISDIPKFPEKLAPHTSTEKYIDSQI